MIAGPRTVERSSTAPGLDDDAAVDLRVDELALDAPLERLEDQAVGLEHVVEAPGVLPPAAHDVRLDRRAAASTSHWIASVISSSPRPDGWIARAASWMRGVNM